MKENKLKSIIKHSDVVTSENFTENLLHKISDKKLHYATLKKRNLKPAFLVLITSFLIIISVLVFIPDISINFQNFEMKFNRTGFVLGIFILFFFSFNQMLRLQQKTQAFK